MVPWNVYIYSETLRKEMHKGPTLSSVFQDIFSVTELPLNMS